MHIIPLPTGLLKSGDDFAQALRKTYTPQPGDILAISSKAIATIEGAAINLIDIHVSLEAKEWSEKCGRTPEFCEAIMQETKRLNGTIRGFCQGALLTQLKPDELSEGVILSANAGLDQSNVGEGYCVGWPHDPVKSLRALRTSLSSHDIACILTDSCCMPRRKGMTAYAMVCSGMNPFSDERGKEDLFGRPLRITTEAVADQLAIAANALMGNASQGVPAAVIRDHGFALSDYEGWVPGIAPEEDLFRGLG